MKEFKSIATFFSNREIDELQAAIDARREARAAGDATSRGRPDPSRRRGVGYPGRGERPD